MGWAWVLGCVLLGSGWIGVSAKKVGVAKSDCRENCCGGKSRDLYKCLVVVNKGVVQSHNSIVYSTAVCCASQSWIMRRRGRINRSVVSTSS
jgi:hypothetical protein